MKKKFTQQQEENELKEKEKSSTIDLFQNQQKKINTLQNVYFCITPQKFINPKLDYILRIGILINESILKNSPKQEYIPEPQRHKILTSLNSMKFIHCIMKSQNNEFLSIFMNSNAKGYQYAAEIQYLIKRLESFGDKNFKQLSDNLSKIEEQYKDLQILMAFQQQFPILIPNIDESIEEQLKIINNIYEIHKGFPVSVFQFKNYQQEFNQMLTLNSIHYNNYELQIRDWDMDEYIQKTAQLGIIEMYQPYDMINKLNIHLQEYMKYNAKMIFQKYQSIRSQQQQLHHYFPVLSLSQKQLQQSVIQIINKYEQLYINAKILNPQDIDENDEYHYLNKIDNYYTQIQRNKSNYYKSGIMKKDGQICIAKVEFKMVGKGDYIYQIYKIVDILSK
ncbi:hypothetical protein PPERSA_07299 [Pseudocohnilembus persalinus]|uniref:Uncharacterized protein n=1 Tax=Pseudocohnilembus persalinus TaxID=266149 RepID=A0A0V0QGH0_PSEPJ|nr:hypothetical protein PPERSA_07299 [Pseudocohnilembus persalinus]|eukprot:KRX01260.1 hypothetical protein PPERSA_07299 [Pseudocohnilembus persalinus]